MGGSADRNARDRLSTAWRSHQPIGQAVPRLRGRRERSAQAESSATTSGSGPFESALPLQLELPRALDDALFLAFLVLILGFRRPGRFVEFDNKLTWQTHADGRSTQERHQSQLTAESRVAQGRQE